MNSAKIVLESLLVTLLTAVGSLAQDASSGPYDQKIDVVYGEVHGTGLLMDVFVPKSKTNGLAVIDVVSGAFYSDRSKIRDRIMGRIFQIFCARGYTVFAVRPGSRTR